MEDHTSTLAYALTLSELWDGLVTPDRDYDGGQRHVHLGDMKILGFSLRRQEGLGTLTAREHGRLHGAIREALRRATLHYA